ncbi:MAG TPA: thiamine phosphate synthase [Candidatus Dormibacteraeota bacterium]|nr:thiamine phosphate synthase [Candidatus Dormibacteraeota bacterium]
MRTDSQNPPTPTDPVPRASAPLRARLAAVRLYVVTDASAPPGRVLDAVEGALAGGAGAVQLRRKGDAGLEHLRLAERCRELCGRSGALFLVNDRLDIAMAVDADGVHVGQGDLPVEAIRRLWPGRIVGRSTHAPDQALAAVASGADHLGVGPVFATPTKPGRDPVGLEYVRWAAANVPIPWVAIGGIDERTVAGVVAAGARAVAVVRAVGAAEDPAGAARRLLGALLAGASV